MLLLLTSFSVKKMSIILKGRNKDEAIFQVLKKYIIESYYLKVTTIVRMASGSQEKGPLQCAGVPESAPVSDQTVESSYL